MSLSAYKHIDRICVIVMVLSLLLTLLFVNGQKKPAGVYGAVGNSAVPAGNQLPCFTGTGRIRFGKCGTILIVR